MKLIDIYKRLDQILQYGEDSVNSIYKTPVRNGQSEIELVTPESIAKFRSAGLYFISKHFGETVSYYKEYERATNSNSPKNILRGIAILKSIKDEIDGGWLYSIKEIVSAELFTDFIEMAEHLLENDYKDPSAVIIGSVLEEHLRQLAIKNDIAIINENDNKQSPKKADTLNSELYKKGIPTFNQ